MKILRSIDIFGKDYNLVIEGKQTFKTAFGGCIVALITVFMVAFVSIIGRNFYLRVNPLIIVEETYSADKLEHDLFTESFPLIFKIMAAKRSLKYSEIPLRINVVLVEIKIEEGKRRNSGKHFSITRCDALKNKGVAAIDVLAEDSGYFCLDSDAVSASLKEQLSIYRNSSNNTQKFIKIDFSKCKEEDCASQEELDTFFSLSPKIGVLMPDNYFNPEDEADLLGSSSSHINFYIGSTLFKTMLYEYETLEVVSDSGYLFEDISRQETFYLKRNYLDTAFVQETENIYATIDIRLNSKVKTVKQSFEKLQTVIANASGIMKIAVFMAQILVKAVSSRLLNLSLISKFKISIEERIQFRAAEKRNETTDKINPNTIEKKPKLSLWASLIGPFRICGSKKEYFHFKSAKKELKERIDFVKLVKNIENLQKQVYILVNSNK